jgi:hypothetical protein
MKYLKKFSTTAEYNAYTADTTNFIKPNVSLTVDNNAVHYNPSTPVPPTPTHDYVEIGGIKWATMNVGANSVTDTGLYFQWGDTQGYTAAQVGEGEGQKYFGENDYIYYNNGSYTKYNEGDSLITLESTDDAVKAAWGGNWRMPTVSEFIALGEAVTSAWTADYQGSGVAGVVLTSNADGATLFFPACGGAGYGGVNNVGSDGFYWSSSLNTDCGYSGAYCWQFDSNSMYWDNGNSRYLGYNVRGVLAEN